VTLFFVNTQHNPYNIPYKKEIMIFKQYLNIAATIAASTTYCTTVAMMTSYNPTGAGYMHFDNNDPEFFYTIRALNAGKNIGYRNSGFQQKQTSFPALTQVMEDFQNPAPAETLNTVEKNELVTAETSRLSKYPSIALVSPGITKKSHKVVDDSKQIYTFNIQGKEVEIKRDNRNPSYKVRKLSLNCYDREHRHNLTLPKKSSQDGKRPSKLIFHTVGAKKKPIPATKQRPVLMARVNELVQKTIHFQT
jgi:hypothetical protein